MNSLELGSPFVVNEIHLVFDDSTFHAKATFKIMTKKNLPKTINAMLHDSFVRTNLDHTVKKKIKIIYFTKDHSQFLVSTFRYFLFLYFHTFPIRFIMFIWTNHCVLNRFIYLFQKHKFPTIYLRNETVASEYVISDCGWQ